MDDCILKIEKLEKSFGDLQILKGIDLEIRKGEVICIIGASGSGKSTLLRCINLLEEADSGNIWFDGQNLMDLTVNLNALRQKIGMVFQSFNLFNNKNVLDNCTLAPMTVKKTTKAEEAKPVDKKDAAKAKAKAGLDKLKNGGSGFKQFVKEQNVVGLHRREQSGEIADLFNSGAGSDLKVHSQFGSDDARKRGLAQARGAVEQNVVQAVAALAARFQKYAQVLFYFFLTHVFVQRARAERYFVFGVFFGEFAAGYARFKIVAVVCSVVGSVLIYGHIPSVCSKSA